MTQDQSNRPAESVGGASALRAEPASQPCIRIAVKFEQQGTFQAVYAAEDWLRARGFSWGPSSVDGPQAIWHGDCTISKWRNLSPKERSECDAIMHGGREGPVTITLQRAATPEARAAFANGDDSEPDGDAAFAAAPSTTKEST